MTSTASSADPRSPGLILALNNCEERLQMAVGEMTDQGPVLLAVQEWSVPGRTVRFMVPGLGSMLGALGRTPDMIQRMACTRGPGSFTGIRLALSAVAGLAAGIGPGVELVGLDYLPLLGAPPARATGRRVWVLTHARRRLVYIQGFEAETGRADNAPLPADLDQAACIIRSGPENARLLGSGIRNNREFFDALVEESGNHAILDESFNTPRPEILLRAAGEASPEDGCPAPLYIRVSDAEENLDRIAALRGMNPDQARRMLAESAPLPDNS